VYFILIRNDVALKLPGGHRSLSDLLIHVFNTVAASCKAVPLGSKLLPSSSKLLKDWQPERTSLNDRERAAIKDIVSSKRAQGIKPIILDVSQS
jgi:hypothetical protein